MTEGRFPCTCFCAGHPSRILSFNTPRTPGACIINPIYWKGSTRKGSGYLSVVTSSSAVEPGFKASSASLHSLGILQEVWGNHPRLSIFSSDCFARARHAVSMPPVNICYKRTGAEPGSPSADFVLPWLQLFLKAASAPSPSLQWSFYFRPSLTAFT